MRLCELLSVSWVIGSERKKQIESKCLRSNRPDTSISLTGCFLGRQVVFFVFVFVFLLTTKPVKYFTGLISLA